MITTANTQDTAAAVSVVFMFSIKLPLFAKAPEVFRVTGKRTEILKFNSLLCIGMTCS